MRVVHLIFAACDLPLPTATGTTPRFWDDPEKHLASRPAVGPPPVAAGGAVGSGRQRARQRRVPDGVALGWGQHGLQSVLQQPTTEMLVAKVQSAISARLAELVAIEHPGWGLP